MPTTTKYAIYAADGTVRAYTPKIEYKGTWMGECYLTVTVKSPTPIGFQVGDYMVYRNERFELNMNAPKCKQAKSGAYGEAFVYEDIKFNALSDELTRCDFLDVVKEDNEIHYTQLPEFSFYASSVQDLADRIQANLDRIYTGDKAWTVEVHPEYAEKTNVSVSVSNIKVWGALELCVNDFGCYFIVRNRTIIIGTAGMPTTNIFKFGKGNGLSKIEEQAEDNDAIITRLRAYGNTTNMPSRYYNKILKADSSAYLPNNMAVNRLMLPGFPTTTLDPYIDSANASIYGIREATVMFDGSNDLDDIHPSLEGMTSQDLLDAGITLDTGPTYYGALDELIGGSMPEDDGVFEEGDTIENIKVLVRDLGFDINDYLTSEDATISFKDGMCGGREMTIISVEQLGNGTYRIELERAYDESLDMYFPNKFYPLRAGDKFVILHIEMPDVYIQAASQRLYNAAVAYVAKNDSPRSVYQPEIDEHYMARQHDDYLNGDAEKSLYLTIKEGDLMLFEDEDLGVSGNIVIDSLTITEGGDNKVPKYEITLREEKTVGTIEKLQNQIDSLAKGQGSGNGYNTEQLKSLIKTLGSSLYLSKVSKDTANGLITFVSGLVSQGLITAEQGARMGDLLCSAVYDSDIYTGQGWGVDKRGNAVFESVKIRSALEVLELIVNRLSASEGDQIFTESDTIESLELISSEEVTYTDDDGEERTETIGTYGITVKSKYDGYFTAMSEGMVLKGIFNNLPSVVGQGMVSGEGKYFTSWLRVNYVNSASNYFEAVMYKGAECPAGVNYPPCEMMKLARWGHQSDEEKQHTWYLSSDEGRIVFLDGVTKPIVDTSNYALILGRQPQWVVDLNPYKFNTRDSFLYVKGIMTGFVDTNPNMPSLLEERIVWAGQWDADTVYWKRHRDTDIWLDDEQTEENPNYNKGVTHQVTYLGCVWQCAKDLCQGSAPRYDNTDWAFVSGNPEFTVEFEEEDNLYDLDNFDCTLTLLCKLHNQDVTADIDPKNVEWTRYSEFADGTPRANEDTAWALQFAADGRGGLKATILRSDLGVDSGYMPKKIQFTATAYLKDGTTAAATYTANS